MHAGIDNNLTELRPPSLKCEETGPNTLLLQYRSHRKGLAPMVVGLLHGLGKRFKLKLEIDYKKIPSEIESYEFAINHFPL